MRTALVLAFVVVAVVAQSNNWMNGEMPKMQNSRPILVSMQNLAKDVLPPSLQRQLSRITNDDILGVRRIATDMTNDPSERNHLIRNLAERAPNLLLLATDAYSRLQTSFRNASRRLGPDSRAFVILAGGMLRNGIADVERALEKQDEATIERIDAAFPTLRSLLRNAQTSVQLMTHRLAHPDY